MSLKFNDHRMQLFPMVANHQSTNMMIAMYRLTPDLLPSCQQAVSNTNIKISNERSDLQVDIINSQSQFIQVSPALCEVVPEWQEQAVIKLRSNKTWLYNWSIVKGKSQWSTPLWNQHSARYATGPGHKGDKLNFLDDPRLGQNDFRCYLCHTYIELEKDKIHN